MSQTDRFISCEHDETEVERYKNLLSTLSSLRSYVNGRRVLDFGASYGLSICALLETGATYVVGVEPDKQRVERGIRLISEMGVARRAELLRTPDTRDLPFADGAFDVVLANAVIEHIPQPRCQHIREMWRVLRPNGWLITNETPNKYLPRHYHTTNLWFVPWMPRPLARRYAIWRGKWSSNRDWNSSGWRGLGYLELTRSISRFADESPRTHLRHHLLGVLGLSPQALDPYPTFVLQKL